MEDYCKQLGQKGLKMVIEREAVVDHSAGSTINMMGLELTPELKWQNRSRFHQKWGKSTPDSIPEGASHPERFLKLGAPNNPLNPGREDRKSTRLNSSHVAISYAVFCLKKKKQHTVH